MSKYQFAIQIGPHYNDIALRYVKDNNGELRKYAFNTEWLCKDEEGNWHVLTDKEYHSLK